ncbi:MAG: MarR family transcriptional regulator [Vicingaceae bacterium]
MKPQETVDYHIKLAWHSIVNLYNQLAVEHELTQATGFVLLNIGDNGGTPATKIAPLMGMKKTSLSRMLKNMEDEGLICRIKDEQDGRQVNICLTEEGQKKKKVAKQVVKQFNEHILSNIDAEHLSCFYQVMQDINGLTEDYRNKKIKS